MSYRFEEGRSKIITFRLLESEVRKLEELARKQGFLNKSEFIRYLYRIATVLDDLGFRIDEIYKFLLNLHEEVQLIRKRIDETKDIMVVIQEDIARLYKWAANFVSETLAKILSKVEQINEKISIIDELRKRIEELEKKISEKPIQTTQVTQIESTTSSRSGIPREGDLVREIELMRLEIESSAVENELREYYLKIEGYIKACEYWLGKGRYLNEPSPNVLAIREDIAEIEKKIIKLLDQAKRRKIVLTQVAIELINKIQDDIKRLNVLLNAILKIKG